MWFPCGDGSELLKLKKKTNVSVFVASSTAKKYTKLSGQAITDNVSSNSVSRLSDYTQRKYRNLKSIADHFAASGITDAAL